MAEPLKLRSIVELFSKKNNSARRRRGSELYGAMEGAEQLALAGKLLAEELLWDHAVPASRSPRSPAQIILANRNVDRCATANLAPPPAKNGFFYSLRP